MTCTVLFPEMHGGHFRWFPDEHVYACSAFHRIQIRYPSCFTPLQVVPVDSEEGDRWRVAFVPLTCNEAVKTAMVCF